MLDGTDLSADSPTAAAPDAAADPEGEGEEDEDEAEQPVDDGKPKATLRITIMQLSGVPEVVASAPADAPADGAPPADADGDAPPSDEEIVVEFSILGKTTTTKPLPRAPVVDFDSTSVEVTVPLSVALRDELLVHGVPFAVYTHAAAPPVEGEDDAETPAPERTLLGVVNTHWGALASGDAELSQVSQALIVPQPPAREKGSKKKPKKPPPPFTLALTASIAIVEK